MAPPPTRVADPGPRRLTIGGLCLLVAGVAVGLWLLAIRGGEAASPYLWWIGVLGGASLVGPPILLWGRRRRRGRWGPGEILWFSEGVSAWLLWPPMVRARILPPHPQVMERGSLSANCFAYGTPLMALHVGSALLFGGWIRPRGRRRRARSWRERFGLILGLLWACTGLYVLYAIYHDDWK